MWRQRKMREGREEEKEEVGGDKRKTAKGEEREMKAAGTPASLK